MYKAQGSTDPINCLGTCIPLTASMGCQAPHSSHTFTIVKSVILHKQHGNKTWKLRVQKTLARCNDVH